MTPAQIYRKTMVFNWYKLGLGILTIFVCAIIFGSAWFCARQFDLQLSSLIGICSGAFLIAVIIYYFIMIKQGFAIKIGHLAVIEYALRNNEIPANPIDFSKDVVQQRFGSSAKYYLFDRELDQATTQISRVIARGFSLDSETPNLKASNRIIRIISLPALHLVDECCLTYALRKNDYEVNAACIDALTILTMNWQKYMSVAFKMSILVYAFILLVSLIFFVPGYAVCNILMMNPLPWVGMSIILAFVFKLAFLDSYLLTKMVCTFLNFAQETTIDRKSYSKLDHWSKAYAKIRKSAEKAAEKAEDDQEKAERKAAREAQKAAQNSEAETKAEPTESAETADEQPQAESETKA